jgi:hypothetical protein
MVYMIGMTDHAPYLLQFSSSSTLFPFDAL